MEELKRRAPRGINNRKAYLSRSPHSIQEHHHLEGRQYGVPAEHPVESYDGKDSGPQPALEALARMREQEQLPPGPLTVDAVLQALERLERRSISQSPLHRELRRMIRVQENELPISLDKGGVFHGSKRSN